MPQAKDIGTGNSRLWRIGGATLVLLVAVVALFAQAGPLTPDAHSQIPLPNPTPLPAPNPAPFSPLQPGGPAPAPFPAAAPGQIGTGTPPQDIFYVSPEGCDASPAATNCPAPIAPNLPCTATNPCLTIAFALSQARDGDAISLAGGTYPISRPIEVNKLVTIGPNGFAAGSLTNAAQTSTSVSQLCGQLGSSLPPSSTCSVTLGVAVLSGSSVTLVITAAPGNLVQVPQGGALAAIGGTGPLATRCTLTTPLPAPAAPDAVATLTYTCAPGQSIPAGMALTVNVNVSANGSAETPPTMTASINPPTTSVRPVVQSCASVVPATSTAAAGCIGAGGPIFRVTAVGSTALHVTIFGLTIGNAHGPSAQAAIILDNDSYTEIARNVIGSEDLPNAIGILLSVSDHPIIHDNTIQGSTLFPRTASILARPSDGVGVVTEECFASINHSNGVQLINNLFAKNANAGVWFCSDGTGGFFVSQNTIRANGRGIVLLGAVDTLISGNTIGDNVLDGIDLLQTSARNQITGNVIESQQGPESAGILLAGNGAFIPLGNQIMQNQIRRNTVGVLIAGAQGTRFTNNSITAVGTNTGVLLSLAIPGWASGQPISTFFTGNALQASGTCSAVGGCAIRLTIGITAPIDATGGNDFGVTDPATIQTQIWDHGRDPSLGTVYVLAPPPTPVPQPILGLLPTPPPAPAPGQGVPTPTPTPTPTPGPASPLPTPTSMPADSPLPGVVTTPMPLGTPAPGLSAASTSQATTYLDPATSSYYVALALCVSDSSNHPVPNDALTVSFFAQNQFALGSTLVSTDASGCFSGNVQPTGSGKATQPVRLLVTDDSGASLPFPVMAGSPITHPPSGPIR